MSNPTLSDKLLNNSMEMLESDSLMSVNGTIIKTCVLGLLTAMTFAYNWSLVLSGFMDKANMLSTFGIFAGLILAMVICFGPKNKFLPITTSLYAMCEGLALGCISAQVNKYFPGVASQAAIATFFALFGMFALYRTGIIKVNDFISSIIINSTFAVLGIYILQFILRFFHINALAPLFSNGAIGIGFSAIVVIVATFNLLLDFKQISLLSGKANKYFEWYCGFSLLVTIIWMYIEILNLLMKLQSRN